jgi:hypothetical protein
VVVCVGAAPGSHYNENSVTTWAWSHERRPKQLLGTRRQFGDALVESVESGQATRVDVHVDIVQGLGVCVVQVDRHGRVRAVFGAEGGVAECIMCTVPS